MASALLVACSDTGGAPNDAGADAGVDAGPLPDFEVGTDGVANPLDIPSGQARAGRIAADQLPASASEYLTWAAGDFVLANERVAMVIEDVGDSDLYDPWGGRPVGLARVEDGALVDPADFGEIFLLVGRMTVMSESVSVIADGTDGGPAIVRAHGWLRPMPFIDSLARTILGTTFNGVRAAIEYVLEPGADHVDIHFAFINNADRQYPVGIALHLFMFTPRMPVWVDNGQGFAGAGQATSGIFFVDDHGASYAYSRPEGDGNFGAGLAISGGVTNQHPSDPVPIGESRRHHARITIGERGLDGALSAFARMRGTSLREVTGRVVDAQGAPVAGVRVHAFATDEGAGHLNRATSAADGTFSMHLPAGQEADLYLWRRGDRVTEPVRIGGAVTETPDLALGAGGFVRIMPTTEVDAGEIPVRIQVRRGVNNLDPLPTPDPRFGEETVASGRLHQVYAMPGEETLLRLPTGEWEVIVSRGYEYEVYTQVIDITDANCDPVAALEACPTMAPTLVRSVESPNVMCADFHIHTRRSNDSGDDPSLKLRSAAADGLEIPGRSEHEYLEDWDQRVVAQGLDPFIYGLTSLELTTFLAYGHFGVVPVDPDLTLPNGGAPPWQSWPTPSNPDGPVETLSPTELFNSVLLRPEQPALIVNHPSGSTNYFHYVGLNSDTGLITREEAWDTRFHAIEVFNDSDWLSTRDNQVRDWFRLLDQGLRAFAVGASDTHYISSSPVGYPRTCLTVGRDAPPLGTDDRRAFADDVRDAIKDGQMVVSGGIYIEANVDGVGPGGDATGLGATAQLEIRVQAPQWVDVDAIEIVVDGQPVETLLASMDDFVPGMGAERHHFTHTINVAPGGSYVVVAAYGDTPLLIHPGRIPFGATNPIFLSQ